MIGKLLEEEDTRVGTILEGKDNGRESERDIELVSKKERNRIERREREGKIVLLRERKEENKKRR